MTERLAFFIAIYDPTDKVSAGGGHEHEGEDIEVLEVTLDEAMTMIAEQRIVDAKTIILLQHLKLKQLSR